jgi:hypothetical protein
VFPAAPYLNSKSSIDPVIKFVNVFCPVSTNTVFCSSVSDFVRVAYIDEVTVEFGEIVELFFVRAEHYLQKREKFQNHQKQVGFLQISSREYEGQVQDICRERSSVAWPPYFRLFYFQTLISRKSFTTCHADSDLLKFSISQLEWNILALYRLILVSPFS